MRSGTIAVVTGASRGLGRATGEALAGMGHTVIMAMRQPQRAAADLEKLKGRGLRLIGAELDVSDPKSIDRFVLYVKKTFGRCDILVNNAGIYLDDKNRTGSAINTSLGLIKKTMETNTYGPILMIQGLIPLMLEKGHGRIVNVSSGMGAFSEMERGYIAYSMSKTALNVVTKLYAAETEGTDILINSVCPGWVRTDMGGPDADRSIEEGIRGIIWAATLPEGGPNGGFFRDGERIAW